MARVKKTKNLRLYYAATDSNANFRMVDPKPGVRRPKGGFLPDPQPGVSRPKSTMPAGRGQNQLQRDRQAAQAAERNALRSRSRSGDVASSTGVSYPTTHVNRTNNSRAGRSYTVTQAKGGVIHDYGNGERVFVRKNVGSQASSTGTATGAAKSKKRRSTDRYYF